jgi:hypothetical protein
VQLELPDGTYAYGRVLRDAGVAFYRQRTTEPLQPPIGSRDFEFTVGVYEDVIRSAEVVGHDPSAGEAEDWPPPSFVQDPIEGRVQIYERGQLRDATPDECVGLERAAVWDRHHLIERLSRG